MPCSRPRAGQRQCRCVSGRVPERAQTGRAVRVVLREFNPCAGPTGGVDKMPNGRHGSAHPLAASPVTSGLREDECTGPSPVCARGRYHTRPAARRGVAGHRQVTGRAAARPVEAVGARGHQGGQCTGAAGSPGHPDKVGWPDGHLSPKAVLTITVGHPVPVTHRPPVVLTALSRVRA